MQSKGNVVLLRCGHYTVLDEVVKVDCDDCQQGVKYDDHYLSGYSAGASAQLGISVEDVARLSVAWLTLARDDLGHADGCQCHACLTARRAISMAGTKLPQKKKKDVSK